MGYWKGSQTGLPTSNLAFLQSILHRVEQIVWRIPQMHATDHGTDGGRTDTGQTEHLQVFSGSKLSRTPAPSASPTTPPRSSPSLGCLHNGLLFKVFHATSPLLYTPEPSLFSLQQPSSHFNAVTLWLSHLLGHNGSSVRFYCHICLVHYCVLGTYYKVRA